MAPLSLKIILDDGAVTRTVLFDSGTKVAEACAIIKEKVLTADDGKEYALFLTSADNDRSGIWLEPHRPLDYYMLRNGDALLYLNKQRNLRVKMLDGSVKTLQVDESKSIGDLMLYICGKIGITNYDEYGLCSEEPMEQDEAKEIRPATGTLTLKRKAQQRERDAKMDELSKKLKTDDNVDWLDQHKTLREVGVDLNETLLLKRRLFFSDRNVDSRDPVQLNLLYVQTRDAILNGRHPVTEDQAADCKIRWIHIRDVQRRILRKYANSRGRNIKLYKYDSDLAFMKPFYKELAIPQVIDDEFDDQNDDDDRNDNCDDTYNDEDDKQAEEEPNEDDTESDDEPRKPVKKARRQYTKPIKRTKTTKNKTQGRVEEVQENVAPVDDSAVAPTQLDPKDPVDAFLLNIGATLKTFSPYHLNLAKSKIFSVVQEHEMQQIVNQPDQSSDVKMSMSNHDHIY